MNNGLLILNMGLAKKVVEAALCERLKAFLLIEGELDRIPSF
jgi:hypothetical protein